MSNGELILYSSEDGAARIQLRAEGGPVWLSLAQIADLFGSDKSVISRHIKAVFDEGGLVRDSVVARYATTAADRKSYLAEKESSDLNLIGTIFLDTADLRARRRQTMRLADWEVVLDGFLRSNELPLLKNAGSVSAAQAEKIAFERYEAFDARRREQLAAREERKEESDIVELERLAKTQRRLRGEGHDGKQ